MKIGILSLQGAFIEHQHALERLGIETKQVRVRSDLCGVDALIFPGGESTVQGRLLAEQSLTQVLRGEIEGGMPVFGTCAGLILLAKQIVNDENVYLGTMSAIVRRNAYGRQLGSFCATSDMGAIKNFPMVFIRAPYIERVEGEAVALASVDGHIVAAREKNMLAVSFHPELSSDLRVHEYFLDMVRGIK